MITDKFKPKPSQIDYTKMRWAPVINCVVRYRGKILLVRRDRRLKLYPGYWNGISGFLDDKKSLKDKVKEELGEEIGLKPGNVMAIKVGNIFHQDEPKYKKTWIVHPILVTVNTDRIRLDWEAENYRWVEPGQAKKFKLLPGFIRVLKTLMPKV